MQNIRITKKNNDGSYDFSDYLFDSVDLYGGDHVSRIIELAPAMSEKPARYVKFSLVSRQEEETYTFKPVKTDSYYLENPYHKGIKFYLEDKNGIKYVPDKNGIINIVNNLIQPIDVVLHLMAEQYSIVDFNKEVVIENINIEIWSN